jgi:haloacid dehalogenase superfamily, subfamily IA, variant 3 with third motif having DD or ED/haloacid dehalogenase superfamily, subfamily IA, variant 1 with third motif having Dx(3-4)D or Dx(3-4)E/beta-phosphoglucomutase family hydrolase
MNYYKNRAFIFDMDGTLVDNMRFHTEAWGKMLSENGIEMNAHDFLVKTAGKTNREILPTVFGDISDEKIAELSNRKETLYRELFLPERKAVAGAVEFLEEAQKLGIKMAVATAAPEENVEFILDGLDLRKYFQTVTTAADVTHGKPNPEIFLKSAEKLEVEPRFCIVFEDALGGFEAARRACMKAIGIATVNPVEEILRIDSVVEAHADFSGLKPQELIEKYLPLMQNAEA